MSDIEQVEAELETLRAALGDFNVSPSDDAWDAQCGIEERIAELEAWLNGEKASAHH